MLPFPILTRYLTNYRLNGSKAKQSEASQNFCPILTKIFFSQICRVVLHRPVDGHERAMALFDRPMRHWKKLTTSNMNQTLGMSYVGASNGKPTEEF
jgi:hypothetical protein